MSEIEKTIASKLKAFQSSSEAGSEELWASISEGLSAEPKKKRRPIIFWFSLAGLFLIGTSAFIFTSNYENSGQLSTSNGIGKEKIQESTLERSKTERAIAEVPVAENASAQSFIKPLVVEEKASNEKSQEDAIISMINSKSRDGLSTLNADRNPKGITGTTYLENDKPVVPSVKEVEELEKNQDRTFGEIIKLPMITCELRSSGFSLPSNKVDFTSDDTWITEKKTRKFSFYAGVNYKNTSYLNSGQSSSLASDLNQSISTADGESFGLMFDVKSFKSYKLMAGLEHHRFTDEFNKTIISDTLTVFNPQTELNDYVIETRRVRHFNKLDVLTIPVEFYKSKNFGKFNADLGVGLSYSFVLNQRGRKLVGEDQIADFSNSEKYFSNFLSLRLRAMGGYQISNNISVETGVILGYQKHNSTGFTSVNSNSVSIIPHIGFAVRY